MLPTQPSAWHMVCNLHLPAGCSCSPLSRLRWDMPQCSMRLHPAQELFGKYGALQRLVLPDTRTLALVELTEPGAARQAFTGLAYRALHHVPLFLEWAPAGIFATGAPTLQDLQVRTC